MAKSKTGTHTGSMVVTPAQARAFGRARRREEMEWKAKSGPLTVRHDPSIIRRKSR